MRMILAIILTSFVSSMFFTEEAKSYTKNKKCPNTTIVFSGKITPETVAWFEKNVISCLQDKEGPVIDLYMNNAPGGTIEEWDDAKWVNNEWVRVGLTTPTMQIVERIRRAPGRWRLRTNATTRKGVSVESAAVMIYLAAPKRRIGCNGYIRPHLIQYTKKSIYDGISGGQEEVVKKNLERLRDWYTDLIVYRSGGEQSQVIENAIRENRAIGWREALDLGLAHGTIANCDSVRNAVQLERNAPMFRKDHRQEQGESEDSTGAPQ